MTRSANVLGLLLLFAFTHAPATLAQPAETYLVGGPLAGVELPLFPTQHGEPAGHPGCLRNPDGTFVHAPEGQAPELLLYPGSVEHYRAYMSKYLPIRSFFDSQSLIRNFVARRLPGVRPDQIEQYAEPLYWVPRHSSPENTGKLREPVAVVRCTAGDPVFRLDLGELDDCSTAATRRRWTIGTVPMALGNGATPRVRGYNSGQSQES